MTTLLAIMNPQAVALAADSAVTLDGTGSVDTGYLPKIFQSTKIFALSQVAPVGVMTYDNAAFMNIPIDTLIKEYKYRLGDKTFQQLEEYADDFCRFLTEYVCEELLDEEHQLAYIEELVRSIFDEITGQIRREIAEAPYDWLSEQTVEEDIDPNILYEVVEHLVIEDVVGSYYKRARNAEIVEGAPAGFHKKIETMLKPMLKGIRDDVFERELDRTVVTKLNYIAKKAVGALYHDVSGHSAGYSTNVVIAGFGQKEVFPSLVEVRIEGIILDTLKKIRCDVERIELRNRAGIYPFAQKDVIEQFAFGVSEQYSNTIYSSFVSHLEKYTNDLLELLDGYLDEELENLGAVLDDLRSKAADSFKKEQSKLEKAPAKGIVDTVEFLPKEQMAEMAEALVNLTSLERRVSQKMETVGGPTDVALITKGDGFVWIKRKNYFPAELNSAYFARKYGARG